MQVPEQEHKSKFIDFRLRRSVHIALFSDTHKDLRKSLVERDLSMQELFQRFSELVISGDAKAVRIVSDLEKDKRSGNLLRPRDAIDRRGKLLIYDLIEEDDRNDRNNEEDEENE